MGHVAPGAAIHTPQPALLTPSSVGVNSVTVSPASSPANAAVSATVQHFHGSTSLLPPIGVSTRSREAAAAAVAAAGVVGMEQ